MDRVGLDRRPRGRDRPRTVLRRCSTRATKNSFPSCFGAGCHLQSWPTRWPTRTPSRALPVPSVPLVLRRRRGFAQCSCWKMTQFYRPTSPRAWATTFGSCHPQTILPPLNRAHRRGTCSNSAHRDQTSLVLVAQITRSAQPAGRKRHHSDQTCFGRAGARARRGSLGGTAWGNSHTLTSCPLMACLH